MEAVLRIPEIGIILSWKRILSGILIVTFCFSLCAYVLVETRNYEVLPECDVIELRTVISDRNMYRENICDDIKRNIKGAVNGLSESMRAERSVISDTSESMPVNTVETVVSEAPVVNVMSAVISEPINEEKSGESVILPDVTVPDTEAGDEVIDEWIEVSGFLCNEEGMIVDYTDAVSVVDGILVIPTNENCVGIKRGSLDGLGAETTEVYIPANISYIEPGVFDEFSFLFYIEAADDNLSYYSNGGILYNKAGEVIVYPRGRL